MPSPGEGEVGSGYMKGINASILNGCQSEIPCPVLSPQVPQDRVLC